MSGALASVLIVEDHQLLAQSLSYALLAEGFDVTVAALETDRAILDAAEQRHSPIVLLDLDLGDSVDGLDLVAPLRKRDSPVLIVTGSSDRKRIAACLERGALGVLPKSTPLEELVQAVLDIAAGRPVLSDAERLDRLTELRAWRAAEQARLAPFEALTGRESQVLAELMDGNTCDAIADRWCVSEATVRSQIRAVLSKLGVGSQLAAVASARRVGWSSARCAS